MSSGTIARSERAASSAPTGQIVSKSPSTPVQLQVVDFFSGCGGTSAALQAAGMQIVAALDVDLEAASTFRSNFPDALFLEENVRTLGIEAFDKAIDRHCWLVFSACAPCQHYSSLRRARKVHEDRTLLLTILHPA